MRCSDRNRDPRLNSGCPLVAPRAQVGGAGGRGSTVAGQQREASVPRHREGGLLAA